MRQRVMRTWHRTNATPSGDEYSLATISESFPQSTPDSQIVSVDWESNPGHVEITWLINDNQ
jgi:hypothetical protein